MISQSINVILIVSVLIPLETTLGQPVSQEENVNNTRNVSSTYTTTNPSPIPGSVNLYTTEFTQSETFQKSPGQPSEQLSISLLDQTQTDLSNLNYSTSTLLTFSGQKSKPVNVLEISNDDKEQAGNHNESKDTGSEMFPNISGNETFIGGTNVTSPEIIPEQQIDKSDDFQSKEKTNESTNLECRETAVSNSTHHRILKCPNVHAFNDSTLKRGTLELEIEHIGGDLNLPPSSSSGGPLVISLRVANANLTSINIAAPISSSQSRQTQLSLKELDLSGNPDFDAASLVNLGELPLLTRLNMSRTALSSLESTLPQILQNVPNIETLNVAFSGIHYLKGSEKLQHLDLAGNMINSVTFSEDVVYNLRYLNMSDCGLRSIDVKKVPIVGTTHLSTYREAQRNLKVLDVSKNQLNYLPSALINLLPTDCVTLNVKDNAFSNSYDKCSLYYLWNYLNSLSAKDVKCSDIHGKTDVLDGFRKQVALSNCDWDNCPPGCLCDRRKKTVDCRNIGLQKIPSFAPSFVEILLLQHNELKDLTGIESSTWCNLRSLYLDDNKIETLVPPDTEGHCKCYSEGNHHIDNMTCFPLHLKEIFLNNNLLQNITDTNCHLLYPLQTLEVSNNKIISAGAQRCGALEHLEVLDLSYNDISLTMESDFTCYPHMIKMNLSHNALKLMQPDITDFMTHLKVVDVSHNNIADFRGEFSASVKCLFTKRSSQLERLYLHYNNLSQLECVLNLQEMVSMKTVTLHDNPWVCQCQHLEDFWKLLQHETYTALYTARDNMECSAPKENKGKSLKDLKTKEYCKVNKSEDGMLMTLVGGVVISIIILFLCYVNIMKRGYKFCRRRFKMPERTRARRRFDTFVVSSSDDYELVREKVVIPLTQRGYSIAWAENAFRPGVWIVESVERAVRNSESMIVFASSNFVKSRWGRQEIRRGRNEEYSDENFKVMALVTDSLPCELNRDLYEIVALRTHVRITDRDYIEKLCQFLPTPAPHDSASGGIYLSETYIQEFIDKLRQRMQERQRQIIPMSQIFHINHERNNGISINVDVATYSSSQQGVRLCKSLSAKDRLALIERFKVRKMMTPSTDREPTSLQYYLNDNEPDEDITDVLTEENFVRASYTRLSLPIPKSDRKQWRRYRGVIGARAPSSDL